MMKMMTMMMMIIYVTRTQRVLLAVKNCIHKKVPWIELIIDVYRTDIFGLSRNIFFYIFESNLYTVWLLRIWSHWLTPPSGIGPQFKNFRRSFVTPNLNCYDVVKLVFINAINHCRDLKQWQANHQKKWRFLMTFACSFFLPTTNLAKTRILLSTV